MPDFAALSDAMIATCDAAVGDAIRYQRAGGPFEAVYGYVDYGDGLRDFAGVRLADNDVLIVISRAQLPQKPTTDDRLILPRDPDLQWYPINARLHRSGTDWQFEVKRA